MVGVFAEIHKGKQLSVGKANYRENLQQSPVLKQHSLHCTSRKLELQEIDRRNQAIMKHIANPNHTVRNKDLAKHWEKAKTFQNMISKANKKGGAQLLADRTRYIQSKRTSVVHQSPGYFTFNSVDSSGSDQEKPLYPTSESRIESLAHEKIQIREVNCDIKDPASRISNV